MGRYAKLPEDYAIDALSTEALRRGKEMGRSYSYGQLVADTTEEERERIVDEHKKGFRRKSAAGTRSEFGKADQDTVAQIRSRNERSAEGLGSPEA